MEKSIKLTPETKVEIMYGEKTMQTTLKDLVRNHEWKLHEKGRYVAEFATETEFGKIEFCWHLNGWNVSLNGNLALVKRRRNAVQIKVKYPDSAHNATMDEDESDYDLEFNLGKKLYGWIKAKQALKEAFRDATAYLIDRLAKENLINVEEKKREELA